MKKITEKTPLKYIYKMMKKKPKTKKKNISILYYINEKKELCDFYMNVYHNQEME